MTTYSKGYLTFPDSPQAGRVKLFGESIAQSCSAVDTDYLIVCAIDSALNIFSVLSYINKYGRVS